MVDRKEKDSAEGRNISNFTVSSNSLLNEGFFSPFYGALKQFVLFSNVTFNSVRLRAGNLTCSASELVI